MTSAELAGPDAHLTLARLRHEAPVSWVADLGGWLVTSHALAVEVMRDAETFTVDDPRFSTAQVVGPSMLSLDGAAHRRHRTPFLSPFRPARISERFGAEVESLTAGLLEQVRPAGRADLRSTLAGPLSVAVMASALGLRAVDATTVLRWYRHIVAAVSDISTGVPVPPEARRAVDDLRDELRAGLAQPGDSVLRYATSTLSEDDVIANAAVMMFGGIETTEGMITNALGHLLLHPSAVRVVRADPALAAAAVEESLRLEPAAGAVDRYATRDSVIGDVPVARGDFVRVSITGANRDPAVFTRPDEYDLTRDNLRLQLSFAQGPHVCIAMHLARLEATAAVRGVLQRLSDVVLVDPVAPTGLVFRKPARLDVAWSTAGAE